MTTVKVWVLVVYMGWNGNGGGPLVVDNIATKEECQRIAAIIPYNKRFQWEGGTQCVEVLKVAVK